MRISALEPVHGLYSDRDTGRGCRCGFCRRSRSATAAVTVLAFYAPAVAARKSWVSCGSRGSTRSAHHRHRKLAADLARRTARRTHPRNR